MSEIKVNKISPASGTDVTLGDSGDTLTVDANELKVNKISPASGTAFTLGDSGDTFTLPSGATFTNSGTATGFGSSDYVLIAGNTISGTPINIDFQGCFTATYDNYLVRWNGMNILASTGPIIGFLDSSNNPLVSNSYILKYRAKYGTWTAASENGGYLNDALGFKIIHSYEWNEANYSNSGFMEIWKPSDTTHYIQMYARCSHYKSDHAGYLDTIGYWNGTKGAVTGLRMRTYNGSDDFIDSGNIAIYGIKHS